MISEANLSFSTEISTASILRILHYAYPLVIFIYFLISSAVSICTLASRQQPQVKIRRNVLFGLILGVVCTFLGELVVSVLSLKLDEESVDLIRRDHNVYLLASGLVFAAQGAALKDSKSPVWYPYFGSWFIGTTLEVVLLSITITRPTSGLALQYLFRAGHALRCAIFLTLLVLYFSWQHRSRKHDDDVEQQSLLGKDSLCTADDSQTQAYGGTKTANTATKKENTTGDSWVNEQRTREEAMAKRLEQDGWLAYVRSFSKLVPYIWPHHDKRLQFRALLVGACLLTNNALNVLVPNQMGVMIDSLTKYTKNSSIVTPPWAPIIVYGMLRFISGGACIGWLRKWLWMPIEHHSYKSLSTAAQTHILSLSCDFHDNKTTSDLNQAINGGRSVTSLLETMCFQVVPNFIDLAVAFAYLWSHFGPYMGLLLLFVVTSYLYTTTKLAAMRVELRREYITSYRKEWTVGYQSLDNWTTATLFNMIPYEREKYSQAVADHMSSGGRYEMSSQVVSATQGLLMTIGLLGALFIGVYQIKHEGQSVGKFTTLLVYWAQLQSPLLFFSGMYRNISHSLLEAERLLEVMLVKPTIVDSPNARPLDFQNGRLTFDDVSFSYDERKSTLKNVSFTVPGGKTAAIVGVTGGGKSTVLKLICRMYDCVSGSILIDGQDIRDVQMTSVRERIGVVPQEPSLYHDTIMNNVRYARLGATDEEVHEACKAAAVHEKIMSFPDGYNSKIGERGIKLSGGEKQRIAIARVILKRADIILLDEATSAVDTETERSIQIALQNLCRNKTTFIVAHRLSTIMNADNILVVMDGEIVESGTHHELVNSKGRYYNLWSKQITPIAATGSSNEATAADDENTLIVDVEVAPQTAKSDNGVQRGGGQTASGAELADATNRQSTRPRNTPAKSNIEGELVDDKDLINLSQSVDRSNTAATDENATKGTQEDSTKRLKRPNATR